MKASYNWLKELINFPHSPEELADLLTNIGLNIDSFDEVGGEWTNVVIGKVLTCEPVPETDHLSYCEVDVGIGETLGIVCGAPNVAAGQIVPVAPVGSMLPGGFKITRRKLKGVTSQGMICSEKELGISDEAAGIMVLPDDFTIGAPLTDYIGKRDYIFDVEITINRGDWLSHLGIAREISTATGIELKMPESEVEEIAQAASEKLTIEIQAPDKCPRYSARIVNGVKIAPAPLWMQERLRNLGVRPISNVVDITNYVALELGHPLHAFDYHLVNDAKIVVRTAKKGEKFITLDEKEHTLNESNLLIADPSRGIALAGVMGGLNSEIRDDTEDVLLECAYFEPVGIRITSRDHSISSESSYRFERGVDPEMTIFAVNRAAYLINRFADGKVLKGIVDNYPKPWKKRHIKLRSERTNKLLGTNIFTGEMSLWLKRLGCDVKNSIIFKVKPSLSREDFLSVISKLLLIETNVDLTLPKLLLLLSEEVTPPDDIDVEPKTWQYDLSEIVDKLLSTGIPESDLVVFFDKLGCEVVSNLVKVSPPSWRHDLEREIDLIEEVARHYGYDKVESAITSGVLLTYNTKRENSRRLISRFKQALVELGFREAINPSLVPSSDTDGFPLPEKPVTLLNPLSEDMSHLRTNLGPSLLKSLSRSINAGITNARLFEWGKCFRMENGKVCEGNRLSGVLIGEVRPVSWTDTTRDLNFYDLKGLIKQFSRKISLDKIDFYPYDIRVLSGACKIEAAGKQNSNRQVGLSGRISSYICKAYGVDFPIWYFDFDGDVLLELAGAVPSYQQLPRYPAVLRDLAFVVNDDLQAGNLEEILGKYGGKYLSEVELFDLFSGKGVPVGKKSLAFHLTFRSAKRTLSDAEVDKSIKRIVSKALDEAGAVLRA
ncbi:MAG: phenylalanine--tRNA ligase subunit beta [Candidatus Hatepunaea meridiana]|nr:phenylalanine--tRNA ligase subunit beta [Candidatus Hatepunaea meridiana]